MKKRILLISIAFPPKSDPESLQVGRYTKYLTIQSEYDLEVITTKNPTLYMETDNHLSSLAKGVTKINEVSLLENRYTNFLIRKIFPALLEYPDPKFSFHLKFPEVAKPNLLYSRSYPISSTLLALKLKRKWPDVPWILHLSDPWAVSYAGDSPATNFHKSSRKWNRKKELESFRLADRIAFTSEKTIRLYFDQYPEFKDKFIITPNVYDDDSVNTEEIYFGDQMNVVYTGGFGQKRDPLFYLQCIKDFLLENEYSRNNINFLFSGPMTQENKNKFKQFEDISEIKHLGLLDYQEMIDLQRKAHVLVNIDTNITDPQHSVFFPSKLLEYFAANRRVLAITNYHSVTYEIVHGNFGDCVEFKDKRTLKSLLANYYEQFKTKNESFFSLKKDIKKFSAKSNSLLLLEEMKKLMN